MSSERWSRGGGGGGGRGGRASGGAAPGARGKTHAKAKTKTSACTLVMGSAAETEERLHQCDHQGQEQVGHAVVELDKIKEAMSDEPDAELVERRSVRGDDSQAHPAVFVRQVRVQWLARRLQHDCEKGAPQPAVLAMDQPAPVDYRETLDHIALGARDYQYFQHGGGRDLLTRAAQMCADMKRRGEAATAAAPALAPATAQGARAATADSAAAAASAHASDHAVSGQADTACGAEPSQSEPANHVANQPASSETEMTHILLNIEPRSSRHGYHTRDVCMAGGKRESGESRRQAAEAELREEAGLVLRPGCRLRCVRCGVDECDGCQPSHWQPNNRPTKVYVFVVPAAHLQPYRPKAAAATASAPSDAQAAADADADALADSMARLHTGDNSSRSNNSSSSSRSNRTAGASWRQDAGSSVPATSRSVYVPPSRRPGAGAGTGAGAARQQQPNEGARWPGSNRNE